MTGNKTIDIFKDDFSEFAENQESVNDKAETIKEVQTFVDLNWSRNKRIASIECMPIEKTDIVAVSCIQNMTYDQRVEILNKSRLSTILLWNLSHVLLKAQLILKAPTDIFVFKFHPKKPNIVVGGLETGQVCMWDLSTTDAFFEITGQNTQNNNTNKQNIKTTVDMKTHQHQSSALFNMDDSLLDDEDEQIAQLSPQMLSYIEKSHASSVSDILWIPNDIVISKSGEILYLDVNARGRTGSKTLDEEQFLSLAGTGDILIWNIAKPEQTEKEKKKGEDAKWIPVGNIPVQTSKLSQNIIVDPNKGDSGEEVVTQATDKESQDNNSGSFLADIEVTKKIASNISQNDPQLCKQIADDINVDELNESLLGFASQDNSNDANAIFAQKMCFGPLVSQLCIGSELGEFGIYHYGFVTKEFTQQRRSLLLEYFRNHSIDCGNITIPNKDTNYDTLSKHFETSILDCKHSKLFHQHSMRIQTIQMSPHFSNICLTIADWRFSIWRLGCKV